MLHGAKLCVNQCRTSAGGKRHMWTQQCHGRQPFAVGLEERGTIHSLCRWGTLYVFACIFKKLTPLPPPPPKSVKVKSVQQSHLLFCSNLIFPELMSASWKSLSRERCNVSGRIYQQGIPVCLPGRIQIWNRWMQRYDRRASIMWASTSD